MASVLMLTKGKTMNNATERTVRLTLHAQRNYMFREFGRDAFKALVGFKFGQWLIQAVEVCDHDSPGNVTFTLVGYGDVMDLLDSISVEYQKTELN